MSSARKNIRPEIRERYAPACAAEHSDLCAEFPCDKFIGTYDPAHGPVSAVQRTGLLAY